MNAKMISHKANKINSENASALQVHCKCINFAYAKHMFIVYSLYVLMFIFLSFNINFKII